MTPTPERYDGLAATVGTFDGLHLGHHAVLDTLRREAAARGLTPAVITFNRHPLEIIAPARAPKLLMPLTEKTGRLSKENVDVRTFEFTREMMTMTARQWMTYLRDSLGVRLIVVGYDNTFGSDGRLMAPADYKMLGDELGVEVVEAPVVEGCSSSQARRAVAEGRMEEATRILGRPFSMSGKVVNGDRLGRTLGFPTANLEIAEPEHRLLPPFGVYVSRATLPDGRELPGVTNIGVRPSVTDDRCLRIETHILDFDSDLYGSTITVSLLKMLRSERKFAGLSELKDAIAADKEAARKYES